ncbi:MAG TPA: hypothetical protein VEJ23_07955 [Solirubrobacteraceae bacterium]|nr:hypothetical protein [Solirubrobacteraceae bacterium]
MNKAGSDTDPDARRRAAVDARKPPATSELRVEIVFGDIDERHAQDIAAEMIGRAHELANRAEQECDVDVSVQLCPSGGAVERDEMPALAPVADPGDGESSAPMGGDLAPRASAGQAAATR